MLNNVDLERAYHKDYYYAGYYYTEEGAGDSKTRTRKKRKTAEKASVG